MNSWRQTSFFSKTGAFKNPRLKLNALGIVDEIKSVVLHKGGEWNSEGDGWFVAGIVNEVNCSGFGHEVDSSNENDEKRRAENLDKIKVKGPP